MHGNKKQVPSSSTSPETIEEVVKFISYVAEDQALLLPGRVPGFRGIGVKLLPSMLTNVQESPNSTGCNSVICGNSFALLWLLRGQPPISVGLAKRATTIFTSL